MLSAQTSAVRNTASQAHRLRRMGARTRAGLAALLSVALAVAVAGPASASVTDEALVTDRVTGGVVYAVAQVGDRTIIGGDFTAVGGVPRNNVAALLPSGKVDPAFDPSPDGVVKGIAATADGSRVFLGGDFTSVSGVPRADVAAVDAWSGAVTEGWQADTNGMVHSLAVHGNRVYVGGTFTSIDDVSRRRLAAIDTVTGNPHLGFNPWPDWTVKSVVVSPDGSKVYAAGGFTAIGGAARPGAGEVLASTGKATTFSPSVGGVALTVALTPDGSRMFFSTTNNRMYAFDPAVSNTPVYTIQTGGDTQAIAATQTEVYFGGHFTNVQTHRAKRNLLASVRTSDGALMPWNPDLTGNMGPWAIALSSDAVIVGGDFSKVGPVFQRGLAYFPGTP